LSARNIFMNAQHVPKIGGSSRAVCRISISIFLIHLVDLDFESTVRIPRFSSWVLFDKYLPLTRFDHWLAPETVGFPSRMHINSDVWGFGILAFQISTGRLSPFENMGKRNVGRLISTGALSPWTVMQQEILSTSNHGVPAFIQDIVRKCSEKNPEKRPSFAELYKHLLDVKL
jgi:serine/threonine protein kinase